MSFPLIPKSPEVWGKKKKKKNVEKIGLASFNWDGPGSFQ